MTPAPQVRRAIALSSFDLPDAQELLLHDCEDCACPVSDSRSLQDRSSIPSTVFPYTSSWIRSANVFEMRLDPDHQLLFNPIGRGGIVVVNELAHHVFRCFQQSATRLDVEANAPIASSDVQKVLNRLSHHDLIHPTGYPPQLEFNGGKMLTAWLHVTNACNLRCPYCYVNKSSEAMDEPVGHAAVEAIVRSAVTHGFPAIKLKYAGGEASLNHHLMLRIHAYAQKLAARAGLTLHATVLSNGVAISPALISALKAEGIRIMISLDGVGNRHDVQRPFVNGKPSFRFVEKTIAQLLEQTYPPHLSITVTNRNADGLAEVVRFALERDLTFSINFFRDNDCAARFRDLRYEEQTMIASLLEAFKVVEEFLPKWSVLGTILDRGQLLEPRQRACGVGQDYVVIDQQGRIAKCHMEIETTLGDVFSDDPLQLVRRDQLTVLNPPVEEKEGCRDCTWRYWCSGGCAVATFKATGRYDIKSPNCNIYKAIYPQALKLEGLRILKYATSA
jgi:uncharacterized protein